MLGHCPVDQSVGSWRSASGPRLGCTGVLGHGQGLGKALRWAGPVRAAGALRALLVSPFAVGSHP